MKIILNKGITILIIVMMVMSFTSLFAYQDSYASADVTAPVIDTASLSVDKTSAVSGDTVNLSVKVTDNVAVSYVEVVYTTPQTNKWSMIYLSYDSTTGYYEKSISISDMTEAGSWTIQMITAADTSGNSVTYDGVSSLFGDHADLSKGTYNVKGTNADVTAPVIDTALLSVDKTSAVSGDTVKLSVKVTDNVAVNYVEVVYTTPQTNKWSTIYLSYDSTTGYYEKSISVSDTTETGDWTIRMITATDTSGNSVTYDGVSSLYGAHADLSKGTYNVSGTSADVTAPVIDTASLSVDKTSVTSGDTVRLSVKVSDNVALNSVMVVYMTPQTKSWSKTYLSYDSTTGYYEKSISVSDTTETGDWTIRMITATDTSGNSFTYDGVSSLYGAHADLSKGTYSVSKQITETVSASDAVYDEKSHGASISGDSIDKSYYSVLYVGRNGTNYSSTTAPTNAGDYSAVFSLTSAGKKMYELSGESVLSKDFSISKAIPIYSLPSDLTAVYGGKLSDVDLPDNFSLMDGSTGVGDAGTKYFKASYNPDTRNYETVSDIDIRLTVKAKSIVGTTISNIKDQEYTGTGISPEITVKDGENLLVSGRDYSLEYINNTKSGSASVVIKGEGNYSGTRTLYFRIIPKKTVLSSVKSIKKKSITVKWENDTQYTGYQIRLSLKSSFAKSKMITINTKNIHSAVIKKLIKGKKYYIQIRAYKSIGGKKYPGAWSKMKYCRVK